MRKQFVNGKVFDYSSITINMTGCSGIEPISIDYEDSQEKEVIFGKGGNTRGFGTGNKSNSVKIELMREGSGLVFDEAAAKQILQEREIFILLDLGAGDFSARAWGCDLSHEYVNINADYRS